MDARVHDSTPCLLGEGALWHPERGELWWHDILGRRLMGPGGGRELPDLCSAMGWVDRDHVLMARQGRLARVNLDTLASEDVAPLAADDPVVRPNDGRADPWGGFWIGTMGVAAEAKAGAWWRYREGEVRRLVAGVTIPNACCFHPDGWAAWTDTAVGVVWRQPLSDKDGWPVGEPEPLLDLRGTGLNPDGAVFDADGTLWVALWGAGRVAGFRDGKEVGSFAVPGKQSSCPAIGPDGTLYVTTAACGIPQEETARHPGQGRTYAVDAGLPYRPEPRVVL